MRTWKPILSGFSWFSSLNFTSRFSHFLIARSHNRVIESLNDFKDYLVWNRLEFRTLPRMTHRSRLIWRPWLFLVWRFLNQAKLWATNWQPIRNKFLSVIFRWFWKYQECFWILLWSTIIVYLSIQSLCFKCLYHYSDNLSIR